MSLPTNEGGIQAVHSFAGILLERSTPTRIPMKGYRTMIGHIISQGIRLGAVVTVAEAAAPAIKRGVHRAATYVADATRVDSETVATGVEEE